MLQDLVNMDNMCDQIGNFNTEMGTVQKSKFKFQKYKNKCDIRAEFLQ